MNKILISVLMFVAAGTSYAASNDIWCVGSATKGQCITNTGAIIPAADGTHNLGSAAKSFGSAWVDGTLTVNNLTVTGTLSPYSTGTFTGEDISLTYGIAAATGVFSGAVDITGALGVTGKLTAADMEATGAAEFASIVNSGTSNLAGQVTFGAAATRSTMTAAGVVTVHASVSAPAVTGTTSVTGAKLVASAGPVVLTGHTIVEFMAITPAAIGETYVCSDCSPVKLATSTGTAVGQFGNALGAQLQ